MRNKSEKGKNSVVLEGRMRERGKREDEKRKERRKGYCKGEKTGICKGNEGKWG